MGAEGWGKGDGPLAPTHVSLGVGLGDGPMGGRSGIVGSEGRGGSLTSHHTRAQNGGGRAMRKQNWRGYSEPHGIAVSGETVTGSWQAAVERNAVKEQVNTRGSDHQPWAR